MDQEAKYWKTKWEDSQNQIELLKKILEEKTNVKSRTKQKSRVV